MRETAPTLRNKREIGHYSVENYSVFLIVLKSNTKRNILSRKTQNQKNLQNIFVSVKYNFQGTNLFRVRHYSVAKQNNKTQVTWFFLHQILVSIARLKFT